MLAASFMTRGHCLIQKLPLQLLIPDPCNHCYDQGATTVRKSPLLLPTPQPHSLLQYASPKWVPYTLPLNRHKVSDKFTPPQPLHIALSLLLLGEAVEAWAPPHFDFLNPTWEYMLVLIWNLAAKESGKFYLCLPAFAVQENPLEGGHNWCWAPVFHFQAAQQIIFQ